MGADASVAAWQHARIGVLWSWLRWPGVRQLIDPLYAFGAKRRYEGLYGPVPEKGRTPDA